MERTAKADIGALAAGGGAPARQASLWAWRVHNEVNARLAGEEASGGGGDAAHPKRPWPQQDACAACACTAPAGCARSYPGAPGGALWDEAAVESFLGRFYGAAPADARADAWDPFGLPRLQDGGGAAGAHVRSARAEAARRGRGGRALDAHDATGIPLEALAAAPGGLHPLAFIALCAAAPVGAYAGCVALSSPRRGSGKPSRSLLSRLMPRLVRPCSAAPSRAACPCADAGARHARPQWRAGEKGGLGGVLGRSTKEV
jgi:hypothetical protein